MFTNYTITKLTAIDYPAALTLWESSVRATHHFLAEPDIQVYKSLLSDTYFDQLQLFGVKGEKGELKGFIAIEDKKIQMLFISPAARGTGIGKALINYVFQHFHVKSVDVNEQNLQAYDFYKYLGFTVTERSEVDGIGKPFPIISMKLP
ncbi:MAG: GNAT family N-acetyltransferase [Pedobacter sp.]|nr:GNAT family N-acetyltransferase [Pedobacter sp.]